MGKSTISLTLSESFNGRVTPSQSRESCAMSGVRYLLDTNAMVCLLRGDQALHQRLQQAEWVGISILSQIEFLAFPNLSADGRATFRQFTDPVDVVGLNRAERSLIDRVVVLRAQHRLKLPDAIIAATAIERGAVLIAEDRERQKLPGLKPQGLPPPPLEPPIQGRELTPLKAST
jgi:tRNA(fMet)-specific endonuclease VapC